MSTFQERFREFAISNFGSLSKLARALGITPQTMQIYLNGRSLPNASLLIKMNELGCDINWLLSGVSLKPDKVEMESYPVKTLSVMPRDYEELKEFSEDESEYVVLDNEKMYFLDIDEKRAENVYPLTKGGEKVIVSIEEKPKAGDIVALSWGGINGELWIYEADIPNAGGVKLLTSTNPAVKPLAITPDSGALIQKVVFIKKR
jgi:transcriptional regulator with XRE-family HTH domain